MAYNISKEKAAAIAAAYTTNGFCKAQALRDNGYSEATSKSSRGTAIFRLPQVVEAVDAIMVQTKLKAIVTCDEVLAGMKKIALPPANSQVLNSDRNTALANLAKCLKMTGAQSLEELDEEKTEMDYRKRAAAKLIAEIMVTDEYRGRIDLYVEQEKQAEENARGIHA